MLGKLEFSWSGTSAVSCEFDRLAMSSRAELLLASILTNEIGRKKISKMIAEGSALPRLRIQGWSLEVKAKDRGRCCLPGSMTASVDGYDRYYCRLAFGLEHVMLITRNRTFLKVNSEASLWHELTSERYTTPLLEEWLPYLRKTMIDGGYLEDALCVGCDCGVLKLGTTDLDAIVVDGLKKGEIRI